MIKFHNEKTIGTFMKNSLLRFMNKKRSNHGALAANIRLIKSKTVVPELKTDMPEGMIRAKQKIAYDYNGDARYLKDVLRGSLVYDDMESLYNGLKTLTEDAKILQVKDRFSKPQNGYRDLQIFVEEPNGVIAEVQLHVREIYDAKQVQTPIYNKSRELEELIKQTTDVVKRQKLYAERAALDAKSGKIYNDAWKRFLKRTNK